MYDLLCVGAGLTSATVCAQLRRYNYNLRVLVLDCRSHIGGNCADYRSQDGHVSLYGPHIYHSPDNGVTEFLSDYTSWTPINYSVTAEIIHNGKLIRVPFPYSKETEEALGCELSDQQIIDLFFRGYSQKMWGEAYENLPAEITGRVPQRLEHSCYFPGQKQLYPADGYSVMIERMFGGAEMALGVSPDEWCGIQAKVILYCGRAELLPKNYAIYLPYRHLTLTTECAVWDVNTKAINYCHTMNPITRRTCYGSAFVVVTEQPSPCRYDEPAPYYAVPTQSNRKTWDRIAKLVQEKRPNVVLAGRIGTYQYLDMWQAVKQARQLALDIGAKLE